MKVDRAASLREQPGLHGLEGLRWEAALTLVRWGDGDHLGGELLVEIPGVCLRGDLGLEGWAELQGVGGGRQVTGSLCTLRLVGTPSGPWGAEPVPSAKGGPGPAHNSPCR